MTAPRRPFGRSFGRRFSTIQPYTPSDTAPTDQHLDTLRQAPAQLRQILTDHKAALTEAQRQAEAHADQHAAPSERATWVRSRLADSVPQIQQRTAAAVEQLGQRARTAYDAVQQRSAAALPRPAVGVEGIIGRQAAWSRVQTLLNAGMQPQQVIDEAADPETLHALAEELPTHLRAAHGLHPDDAQQVIDTVHDRLAEISGDSTANARLAAREADVHMAGLEPLLGHARGVAAAAPGTPPDGFGAAVAAQQARERMAAGLPLATDETTQAPTGRDLASAITRRGAQGPTRLRHAITDQMHRAAGRPNGPTDQPSGTDPTPAA